MNNIICSLLVTSMGTGVLLDAMRDKFIDHLDDFKFFDFLAVDSNSSSIVAIESSSL